MPVRRGLVRLTPRMGKAENVSRRVVVLTVAGSVDRIWLKRASTWSSASTMSTFQVKKTLISAEPRPVVERMRSAPGISFIASSMGRVTVAIISSAGMTPLSTMMTTRGKVGLRKDRRGQVESGVDATQTQRSAHKSDREPMANGKLANGGGCLHAMLASGLFVRRLEFSWQIAGS